MLDDKDKFFIALLLSVWIGFSGFLIFTAIKSCKSKPVEQHEQENVLNETESVLNEVEQLKQEVLMLQNEVEILSFEKEEIYSILESEICKRNTLKDVLMLSEDDLTLLAKLVKREAGGEPFECKVCVCLVVFNRMCDSRFKNTLSEVIYENGQFSPAENDLEETVPTEDCYYAVKTALNLTYNEINEFYGTDLMFFRAATEEKVFGKNTTYAFTNGKTDFYRLTK